MCNEIKCAVQEFTRTLEPLEPEWHVSMFVVSDFTYTVICKCYCLR